MTEENINRVEELKSHSAMLGQIAGLVSDFCDEEMTTYDGVAAAISELESETAWANHYCRKLCDARREGYLPDDFDF